MTQFYPLSVRDVRRETPDCVSIAFDLPDELVTIFSFEPGQNVTLKLRLGEEDIRRTYSICSSPSDNELRIAVKQQELGKFSGHANSLLKAGDVLEVLPPSGRFINKPQQGRVKNYLAFAAGSGITPVFSIIKSTLALESGSSFTLVYGNRNRQSIIFKEDLDSLKNRYMHRFAIHHILSREQTDSPLNTGRIDAEKCAQLSSFIFDIDKMDDIFICGPEKMIFSVRDWLSTRGVAKDKIHFELFTVPGQKAVEKNTHTSMSGQTSTVRLKIDGVLVTYELPFDGSSILDGALRQGADLPYACKGGVCATCRAKLLSGEVEMDTNYALEQDEIESGYILTCQSHPRSSEVSIDFDAK